MTDKLSRSDIVRVAVGLLSTGGLHALAMRRIAAELGVQQSALYWHFDSKQQLIAAVADELLVTVEPPDEGDWASRVTVLAERLRAQLLEHPDGAELVATAIAFRLGAQRPFGQFTTELVGAGLAPERAEVAASVLVHFILGYTTDEQQHRQAAALGAIEDEGGGDGAGRERSSDDRFAHGIELIVAGIGSQLD